MLASEAAAPPSGIRLRGNARIGALLALSWAVEIAWLGVAPAYLGAVLFFSLVVYGVGRAMRQLDQPARFRVAVFAVAAIVVLCVGARDGWVGGGSELLKTVGLAYLMLRWISFVLDAYWRVSGEPGVLGYLGYVFFFGTFLSGPIEKPAAFARVLAEGTATGWGDRFVRAIPRLVKGAAKTYLIAPYLHGSTFLEGARHAHQFTAKTAIAYSAYEFVDFSGYCDLVVGLSLLMGVGLTENFDRPYLANSPKDLWLRWHRSLTFFLRDYFYMPLFKILLKARTGRPTREWILFSTLVAYLAVFLASGLWHSRTWGGVWFGLTFFAFLGVHAAWGIYGKETATRLPPRFADVIGWAAAMTMLVLGNALYHVGAPRVAPAAQTAPPVDESLRARFAKAAAPSANDLTRTRWRCEATVTGDALTSTEVVFQPFGRFLIGSFPGVREALLFYDDGVEFVTTAVLSPGREDSFAFRRESATTLIAEVSHFTAVERIGVEPLSRAGNRAKVDHYWVCRPVVAD